MAPARSLPWLTARRLRVVPGRTVAGTGTAPRNSLANPLPPESAMHRPFAIHPSFHAVALAVLASLAAPAHAEFVYGRVVPGAGLQPNNDSEAVDVSADGRTVVFSSAATNWGPDDGFHGTRAIAVDLDLGVVETVSKTSTGVAFRGEAPVASADGRYVAFLTYGSLFGSGWQVVRKDRQTGEIQVASSDAGWTPANNYVQDDGVAISADGRSVVFVASSSNLGVATGGRDQVIVKDMVSGQVKVASVKSDGSPSDGYCNIVPRMVSADGRHVGMICDGTLVPGVTGRQTWVRDLQTNTTELVSRVGANGPASTAFTYGLAMSPSGRFVTFRNACYGGLGQAGGTCDGNSGVYLRDRQTQTTYPVPRPAVIPASYANYCQASSVSDIGTIVMACAYKSDGTNQRSQVFLYVPGQNNLGQGTHELISVRGNDGQPGNGDSGYSLAVSANGLSMVFESKASDLDPGDTNGRSDIFVFADESVFTDVIFADGFEQP